MRVQSNADRQLTAALNELMQAWSLTSESWRDAAREGFEKAHIEPLRPALKAATGGIAEINQLIRRALSECS